MTTLASVSRPVRIGLWGAPGSGKTTFLAALYLAVARSQQDIRLIGNNDDATEFLVENTHLLTNAREFPRSTHTEHALSWTILASTETADRARFGKRVTRSVPLSLRLELLDAPGASFGLATESAEDRLAGCDGILYIFDPVIERSRGDAYEYFHRTLFRLAERQRNREQTGSSRLPYYLAVCITKFDDPYVYRMARRYGYVSLSEDPSTAPRVRDELAPEFFAALCEQSTSGDADLIYRSINRYFSPERVKYFFTSAIGFYAGKGRRFLETDTQNIVTFEDGKDIKIRGQINPINVIEPILWLGQSVLTRSR